MHRRNMITVIKVVTCTVDAANESPVCGSYQKMFSLLMVCVVSEEKRRKKKKN